MPNRFFSGVAALVWGFRLWTRRPGVMALGLVPAAIVGAVLLAALITLATQLGTLTLWMTPFANEWAEPWPVVLRIGVGVLLVGGAVVLMAVTFTALTLTVGDPFYERVWSAAESELGGEVPGRGVGFWRSVRDGLVLILWGIVTALTVGLIGILPGVGAVLGPVAGVVLTGRLLARELTTRAFEARGIDADARRALLRSRRVEMLGFGVATALLFLIPLGAVLTMPAAVAGATKLARSALDAPG